MFNTQVAFPENYDLVNYKDKLQTNLSNQNAYRNTSMSLLSKHFCWLGWAGLGWAGVMLTDVISRAVAGAGSYFPRVQTFKIANLHTNNQQLSEPRCIFSCIRDQL